jgi:pilus assembly protein CpaE
VTDKILVVDDDANLLKMSIIMLERAGYKTEGAQTGEAALEIIKTWQPDLFLIDVTMPGMSGFDLVTRLRQIPDHKKTPIIILTSLAKMENKATGFQAGADDYITKPFQKEELLLRVNAILRRSKMSLSEEELEPYRVITVFSLRGGSGCTTLAVNLAVALSQMWQDEVALLDLVMPVGSCDVAMNLNARYNISDIMTNQLEEVDADLVSQIVEPHESGVHLIGGNSAPEMADFTNEAHVRRVIDLLRDRYRYTVIDTAHRYGPETMAALDLSDSIILAITPDVVSVRLARTALKIFEMLEYDPSKIIVSVNWTFETPGLTAKRIASVLKRPVANVIPYLGETAARAINIGVPIMLGENQSQLLPPMADLAWKVSLSIDREHIPELPPPLLSAAVKRNAPQ